MIRKYLNRIQLFLINTAQKIKRFYYIREEVGISTFRRRIASGEIPKDKVIISMRENGLAKIEVKFLRRVTVCEFCARTEKQVWLYLK